MSTHDGHRKRLKNRMLNEGLDNFENHNVLELLLFYSVSRKDTNELAHKLLEAFGSISGVLDAEYEDLLKIKGVTENSASLLKFIPQLCRRYMISLSSSSTVLDTTQKAGEYLLPRFLGYKVEVVLMVCLDVKCKVLGCEPLFEGNTTSAQINMAKIAQTAFKYNASCVILAHNHVGGLGLPSEEDTEVTLQVDKTLRALNIKLLDHIIVADNNFISMADNGILRQT